MAHGDYKCCAVCDSKQEYVGENDSFKDDICESCRESSGCDSVKNLMEKINSFSEKSDLEKWLKEIGMSECYYQNDVDDLISFRLTGMTPEKFKSAMEFLQGIGVKV